MLPSQRAGIVVSCLLMTLMAFVLLVKPKHCNYLISNNFVFVSITRTFALFGSMKCSIAFSHCLYDWLGKPR